MSQCLEDDVLRYLENRRLRPEKIKSDHWSVLIDHDRSLWKVHCFIGKGHVDFILVARKATKPEHERLAEKAASRAYGIYFESEDDGTIRFMYRQATVYPIDILAFDEIFSRMEEDLSYLDEALDISLRSGMPDEKNWLQLPYHLA